MVLLAAAPAVQARPLPLPLKRARVTLRHFMALDDARWRELKFHRSNRGRVLFTVREYSARSFGGAYDLEYTVAVTRRGPDVEAIGGTAFEPYYEPY